jgi:hypothetical protein
LRTTFFTVRALARLRLELADLGDHRVDVVDQLRVVEAQLPTSVWTLPPVSLRNSTLPAAYSRTAFSTSA